MGQDETEKKTQGRDRVEPKRMQKVQNVVTYTAEFVNHTFSFRTSSSQGKRGNLFTYIVHSVHEIKRNCLSLRGHTTVLGMKTRPEFLLRFSETMM